MIKKLFVSVAFLWVMFVAVGQSTKATDSLLTVLEHTKPLDKAQILNKISQSYLPALPLKCKSYAEQALSLANKHNDMEQAAIAYKNIGASLFTQCLYPEALEAYQKSRELFVKQSNKAQYAAVIINIGLVYRETNRYNEAMIQFSDALSVYRSISDKSGMSKAYHMIGGLALKQGNYQLALTNYNGELEIQKSLNNQADIATAYYYISLAYREANQFTEALENCQQALNIRLKINNPALIANSLNDIGSIYRKKNDYNKALEYYFRALKIRNLTGDDSEIANSYQNIGTLYGNLGNVSKAREYFLQAYNTYNVSNDQRKIALTLTTLGNIERDEKNFEAALNYYQKALNFRLNVGDKKEIAASYNNIGQVYSDMNKMPEALTNFKEAQKLRKEIGDNNGLVITLNDIGFLYESQKNKTTALTYYLESYNLAQENANSFYISLCGRKLADIYISMHDYPKAILLLERAHAAGLALNNADLHKKIHYSYYQLYFQQKDYPKALEHFSNYSHINDSANEAQNSIKMYNLQQSLEIEKSTSDLRNEIKYLRHEKEFQEKELRNKRILVYFLGLVIAMIFLLVVQKVRQSKKDQKHREELAEKLKEIESAHELLKISETDLKSLNATKDKFFAVIAHDIKNPLSALLNLSHIITEKSYELKPDEIQRFNEMIYQSANNLNNLLENLLNWARSNSNKLRFYPLPLKLHPVVHSIYLLNRLTAENKKIEIENKVPEDVEVFADQHMLTAILRNLVSNALKFTPEGGFVTISVKETFRFVEISVADSGQGIEPENMNKLFRLDSHFTTPGTSNETGTGLGLILVKDFVEKNGGQISVKSILNVGSTFTFTLPTGKD